MPSAAYLAHAPLVRAVRVLLAARPPGVGADAPDVSVLRANVVVVEDPVAAVRVARVGVVACVSVW